MPAWKLFRTKLIADCHISCLEPWLAQSHVFLSFMPEAGAAGLNHVLSRQLCCCSDRHQRLLFKVRTQPH